MNYMDTSQQSKIGLKKPKLQSGHKIAKWLADYVNSRGRKKILGVRSPLPEGSHWRRDRPSGLFSRPARLHQSSSHVAVWTVKPRAHIYPLAWCRDRVHLSITALAYEMRRLVFPPGEQNCRCFSDLTQGKRLTHHAMPTLPSDGRLK